MDLQEVIKGCQRGEKEAFRQLFESVEKKAFRTAYYLCGDKGIAEDILQETYMRCFIDIEKLKEPQAFNVWFFRILVRMGWKISKKSSKVVPMEISSEKENLFFNMGVKSKDEISECETRKVIQDAVNSLSENLKTVVILYYYNDFSIEEISKITGCLKATVKSRLFYARNVLKKKLGFLIADNMNLHHEKLRRV